jgi:hypothetical protein
LPNNLTKNLKEKYTQLADSDLKFETGKENELLSRVDQAQQET